jgi:L-ascorbate metabolism protein UlaG (beta-lactamase superfamily)
LYFPKEKKHHKTDGFKNYPAHISGSMPNKKEAFKFLFRRVWYSMFPLPMNIDYKLSEEQSINQFNLLKNSDSITWLGHASFLIKINNKHILTDPHLTPWASSVPGTGPKRFSEPGISIKNLPKIDMIIISHSHYDHLSKSTLKQLPNKEDIHIIIPLGLKYFFEKLGYTKITELDWHENIQIENIKFTALPARHHSRRTLFDKNKTLWASWLINFNDTKVYFSGDTAYSSTIFKEINSKYGDINYALVPIGAYEPRKIMKYNHTNPKEAVQIGLDLKAKNIIAMHWGTFNLTDESPDEPPRKFLEEAINLGYEDNSTWVMKIGESRTLN